MSPTQPKQVTHCMFCNSTSYGTGCPYSPHKKHVHISSGQKCIYCGSSSIGTGCPYNPFSKLHVRGVEYSMMMKESVHQSLSTGLFLCRLTEPIEEMAAYKLKIIDDQGRKMRDCITEEDKAAFTPIDMHILKIRRLIGEHVLDLFKSNVLLEMASQTNNEKFDIKKYTEEVKLISQIDQMTNGMSEIFDEGIQKGFSRSHIENLIIESIIKKYEDRKD